MSAAASWALVRDAARWGSPDLVTALLAQHAGFHGTLTDTLTLSAKGRLHRASCPHLRGRTVLRAEGIWDGRTTCSTCDPVAADAAVRAEVSAA